MAFAIGYGAQARFGYGALRSPALAPEFADFFLPFSG
jgi:hypothetical protein